MVGLLLGIATTAAGASGGDEVEAVRRGLSRKALSARELVPQGFAKAAEARGDLNGDGLDDVALLIHQQAGETPDEALPQVVLAFLQRRSGKYSLWKVGGSHFIRSDPYLMAKNGVGTFEIAKGVLTIGTNWMMSMGSSGAGGCTQKWRNSPAGFQLIGLTVDDFSRACACGSTTDTNLVTGVEIFTTDRGDDGEQLGRPRVTRTKRRRDVILWEDFDYDTTCSAG